MTVAWPGEQLALYDVVVEAGPLDPYGDLYYALDVRESADTTVTVNAGDQFYLYSDIPRLAIPGDVLGECNWIIDVTAGAASVTVETGFDPDWSYSPPFGWAPTAVSSLVAGRAVVPLPAGDRSFERLWNDGAPLLRVTVISGSATLRAAWLQVEPPDGLKVLDGWTWSTWTEPGLVPAKADAGNGNAGAGVTIPDDADPNHAMDAVRHDGSATRGSSLAPPGTAPYSYMSLGPTDGDLFATAATATGYDRSGAVLSSPPESYADLNIGYSNGYWRERPTLRQLPPEFSLLKRGRDWVPINPSDFTWTGSVEFDPDGHTVGIRWADIYLDVVAAGGGSDEISGNIGYATGILLAPVSGWTGSFGSWPPPLGAQVVDLPAPHAPDIDPLLPMTPAPGSDWTITAYTDMAVGAYPVNDEWQQWDVRPHGGSLGTAIYIWHQMPDYRYRVPVFVPSPDAVGREPQFFVRIDGIDRAVGFGKPADDDGHVFAVSTALGQYRDMTLAEYASVAGPLPDFTPDWS
ncbi:hypothetical protein [Intrasporangium flavum]|uniref:hypothetical protein n=1 Tax=Intrasporangium flavum TaxID=1428657 RepID=UPI00096D9EEC|nr:hypothetical protein [Intrasporangium flavum]